MNIETLAILKPALRTRRLALVALARWGCLAVAILFFCMYATSIPWSNLRILDSFFGQGGNAVLAAQARQLDLKYEAVLADPKPAVGKPVIWCVDHPSGDSAYVEGKPSQVLHLQDPLSFPFSAVSNSGGRCNRVLAVITDVERGIVTLRFVERR